MALSFIIWTSGGWRKSEIQMGPKTPVAQSGKLFRQPLREQINLKHPIVRKRPTSTVLRYRRISRSRSAVSSRLKALGSKGPPYQPAGACAPDVSDRHDHQEVFIARRNAHVFRRAGIGTVQALRVAHPALQGQLGQHGDRVPPTIAVTPSD